MNDLEHEMKSDEEFYASLTTQDVEEFKANPIWIFLNEKISKRIEILRQILETTEEDLIVKRTQGGVYELRIVNDMIALIQQQTAEHRKENTDGRNE